MTRRNPAPHPIDLVIEFGDGNASRSCKHCDAEAVGYVLSNNGTPGEGVSVYVCPVHIDKTVTTITRGEYDTLPNSELGAAVEQDNNQSGLAAFAGGEGE